MVYDVRNFAKKLRYFRFPPNVAHRKLTDVPRSPRSRPRGSLLLRRFVFRMAEARETSDWWWTARDHGKGTERRLGTRQAPGSFELHATIFQNLRKCPGYGWFTTREYVASFAKNECLYRQISTKYKSSKLFWRILEDNKQNKHENRGKKTVWILRADRR